jgi:hypothetical protein
MGLVSDGCTDALGPEQFFNAMETRRSVADRADSVVFKGRIVSFRLFPLHDGLGAAAS